MKHLNLFAPISSLGYGVAGLNILKELSKTIHVGLSIIGNLDANEEDSAIAQKAIDTSSLFAKEFHEAPCLKIWHEFSLAEHIGKGKYFAFPFFEINQMKDRRANHLSYVDEIVVSSQWAKDVITNENISVPISVVPLGVDRAIFTHEAHRPTDKCVFLNAGKWEKRKGHDVLLHLFQTAFPTEKDVALHMMPSNPFLPENNNHEWQRYYTSDPRVRIFDRVATHKEVAEIMSTTNCGIFPSRAEGWNLELLEMMSMGKHVIATNYSAHTQFCNNDNTSLIEIDNLETADDGLFFNGTSGEWAAIEDKQIEQGVEYLRGFYKQWQSNPSIINQEGINTAKRLSWTNTANQLEEIIYGN